MVRLEMRKASIDRADDIIIYIPVWLDQKFTSTLNKDREIIQFTFQYGQIRNINTIYYLYVFYNIYIPVWLDQKYNKKP